MGFVVEAWFHDSAPEAVARIFRSSLATAGFVPITLPTSRKDPWERVTLRQHKVLVALSTETQNYLSATVRARIGWDEGYSAFEHVFIYLLNHGQRIHLAELLLSTRNPQPYSFLTHSQGWFPPTIVDQNVNKITEPGEGDYWAELGPELHFISNELFERTQVDVTTFAQGLSAGIIPVQGGVVLDCGWTKEFALPKQLNSI
jgi:hypothetical protein